MIITVTGLPGIIESIRSGIDNLTLLKKIRGTAWGSRLLGMLFFVHKFPFTAACLSIFCMLR